MEWESLLKFVGRGSRVRKEEEMEDIKKRELFLENVSEKMRKGRLKKKDEKILL